MAEPSLEIPTTLGPIGGRPLPALHYGDSAPLQILGQGPEPNLGPTPVNIACILDGKGAKVSGLIPVELGAIHLTATLEAPNPVLEHGCLDRVYLAPRSFP